MISKRCPKCKTVKFAFEFSKSKRAKDGLASWCKPCMLKAGRRNYRRDPEKQRKRANEWRRRNPEKLREYRRRKSTKERGRIYNKTYGRQFYSTQHGVFIAYRNNSKSRKIPWNLTEEQFIIFDKKPCFYCGCPMKKIGLDRVNNAIGYEVGNVVPCCTKCNLAKRSLSQAEFLELCRKIAIKHPPRRKNEKT